jgi:hypothetical protein
MKTNSNCISLNFFGLEAFEIKAVGKMKIHISYQILFFTENLAVYEMVARNATEIERPKK